MKRLADRGSLRPPRRGYLAPCAGCGLEVVHSKATGQPVAQHLSSKAHLEATARAQWDVHRNLTADGLVEVTVELAVAGARAAATLTADEAMRVASLIIHAARPVDA